MSVLLGWFAFDMRDIRGHADALRNAMRVLDEDDEAVRCEPGIAVGIGTSRLWWDASPAMLQSPSGRIVALDGRIDNREDLLIQLDGELHARSDAAVAVAAFDRWGIAGLARIVGEWSAAIWDPTSRTLHLARDYMGTRPLYYATGDRSVMWSTSLGELAIRSDRADALSEAFVAAAVDRALVPELTPYEGIRAVLPGTCVSLSADGTAATRRFWTIGASTIRLRGDGDYEEALRSLWSDSVRVRLRTAEPVWAELSGGLDSSSVVCMADALIRGGVGAGRLHLISHATFQSPEGDERRFIAEIERRTGACSEVFGVEEHRSLVDDDWAWVSPAATRGVQLTCLRRIRRLGGRLVLSGRMGDTVMGCDPDNSLAAFDDLTDGGMMRAVASVRAWSRALRQPFWLTTYRLLRWLADSPLDEDSSAIGEPALSLLTPRLQGLAAEGVARAASLRHIRPAKRGLARSFLAYASTSRIDSPLLPPGITYAYPFTHRPLVEFVMAIPTGVLSAPGETRSLMRRAFAGLVPSRVLGRQSKGFYSPTALRDYRSAAARLLSVNRLEIVERGWVDPAALHAALQTLIDSGAASHPLRRVLRLEEWLAIRQRRGPAAIPQRKEVTVDGVQHA